MRIAFGTKAETLERLMPLLTSARVLPQYRFRFDDWSHRRATVLAGLEKGGWYSRPAIVRSSAKREDGHVASLAGRYVSVADVRGETDIATAIECVFCSYVEPKDEDQVFVQPDLQGVELSGVAFGLEPNTGSPYLVVNYELGRRIGGICNGVSTESNTFYWFKDGSPPSQPHLASVANLIRELEGLLGTEALDVEFAWANGELYLLQVRPLPGLADNIYNRAEVRRTLESVAARVYERASQFPQVQGAGVALGVMPDWNPAEMIGLTPRSLSASIYRECITNRVWAEQRVRYGYRDVIGVPLMECIGGQPFIDVRASFTSFVPAALDDDLAGKLVDYYLASLRAHPELHDKVETELVFHCWTFDLPDRLLNLASALTVTERSRLAFALRDLTARVIVAEDSPWHEDRHQLTRFSTWLDAYEKRDRVDLADLRSLLQACIECGGRPFAGLARTGFIATSLLRSLVRIGLWSEEDWEQFLRSLRTIVSRMCADRVHLTQASFLRRYGHLRPGTYDILVPRYDESPDCYFTNRCVEEPREQIPFSQSSWQTRELADLLRAHEFPPDAEAFLRVMGAAIEAREYGKFVYSRGVSELLRQFGSCAARLGFSLDDCSYADVTVLREALTLDELRDRLAQSIASGRAGHQATNGLSLPPLLLCVDDVWAFHLPHFQPNFITRGVASGPVRFAKRAQSDLVGSILLLPSADPGYDWIFTAGIAAFVTMFGGANSHMAIRARELNMPAAIGVGDSLFRRLGQACAVRVDCRHKQLVVLE